MSPDDRREPLSPAVRDLVARLEAAGAQLTLELPGGARVPVGPDPTARVVVHTRSALESLFALDVLALAEAHLSGEIDIDGDYTQVVRLHAALGAAPTWRDHLGFALRLLLRDRTRLNRDSIAFHYDRPAQFFLPWLDRWRSYSHGFYATPAEQLTRAQERKLQFAIDALGLEPGMEVLDVGAGWGCFVEYAGSRGIRVHGLTLSREQHRFVEQLIAERALPCAVELADFLRFRPTRKYDGAVFMGSFEHLPGHAEVARRLAGMLRPGAGVYADFCARRDTRATWGFLRKYIYTGTTAFVAVDKVVRAFAREGFLLRELRDDTLSYAWTVRDWARALERHREEVAKVCGESTVRAFLLWLWASHVSFLASRTQAYRFVASRGPGPPRTLQDVAA